MNVHTKKIFTWRNQYNPLRSLTLTKAILLFEDAERGRYADLQWLYKFVEKRDATLRAVKRRVIASVKKLDYEIKISEQAEKLGMLPLAMQQQAALKDLFENIENIKEAMEFCVLASFRGYSHLEKCYFNDMPDEGILRLETVPQWHWVRRWPNSQWLYNKNADQTNNGIPIPLQKFVIREVEDPIDEIGLIAFIRKNMSQKDWDAFVETYGIPPLFIEMPEGAPEQLRTEYQTVAEQIIGDGRGVLPFGATIQTVKDGERGTNPFSEHLRYQDEQIVMAATSGKLTVLNDPTGLGSGQSKVHQETFDEIAKAEADSIGEVFQDQIAKPLLNQKFPGQQHLAYFEIVSADEVDVKALIETVSSLEAAGIQIDIAQLNEKTGLNLTRTARPMVPGMGQPFAAPPNLPQFANRTAIKFREHDDQLKAKLLDSAAKVQSGELSGLRNRISRIMLIDDIELRNRKLKELKADLPNILSNLNRDPSLAELLEKGMIAAFFNGLETANT